MSEDAKVTIDSMKSGTLPPIPTSGANPTPGINNNEQRGLGSTNFGLETIQKGDE